MTPLEGMAKAFAEEHDKWRLPNPENHQCSKWCRQACLRAALLALADSACPRELLMPLGLTARHWAMMRAILRAIAEGK